MSTSIYLKNPIGGGAIMMFWKYADITNKNVFQISQKKA